ncbi:uncharacterized protein LOC132743412, partial [Ruditapes philippinarum]|uniref:uncharacterized protein LOC132743412 n=1 Tax=Ruditapes philippinarum TaxID=129788 RepID=UPI00295AEA64
MTYIVYQFTLIPAVSESPTKLEVAGVTSRAFDISWEKPGNTYSEENYGYVLQIKDETSSCWKEVIYRCSDCSGNFRLSSLDDLCDPLKRDPVIDTTKQELASKLTYTAVLHPDIVYTVSVTAINDAGRGHPAIYTQRTNEEAPQKPYQVSVTDINSTSFVVNWEIGSPRPGNTTYTIKIMTDIAQSKEFNVVGYENRNYLVTGLEEFWNYNVTVTASTSIGPNTSDVSDTYQTLPAAPGKVHDFRKHDAPNGDYLKLKITWKAPVILERNSIIKEYKYVHNASEELESPEPLSQNEDENYEYNVMLIVVPEEYYSFEVLAVNEQDLNGEPVNKEIKTKAGVPINIEKTQNVDVVEGPKESSQQRQFTVTFAEDFFNQTTNGAIRATGFVVCKDSKCDSKDSMSLSDFNTLDAWSVGLKKGYYRATEADWLKNLKSKTSTPNSRRKREVVKQQFIVGSDSCSSNTDSTEYCNGPVDPDTSYIVIAVACTNGGCLISKKYGPFVTAAEPDDTNLGLIIGIVVAAVVIVVLAAVIIVLVLRRRRGRKSDGMKRTHDTDDEDVNFDPATEKIPRKRPINLNEIEEYVANMHKDSNLLFSAEYE